MDDVSTRDLQAVQSAHPLPDVSGWQQTRVRTASRRARPAADPAGGPAQAPVQHRARRLARTPMTPAQLAAEAAALAEAQALEEVLGPESAPTVPPARSGLERLAAAELAPLWEAVREALERSGRHAHPVVTVEGLGETGRRALADLVDLPEGRGPVRVDLVVLDAAVRARTGRSLRDAVRGLPVPAAPAPHVSAPTTARAQAAALAWLEEHPTLARQEWSQRWLEELPSPSGTDELLDGGPREQDVVTALEVLSAVLDDGAGSWRGRVELASFAGGSHRALDDGSPVVPLVLRGLAAAADVPLPADAAARRALWVRHGVLPDQLSVSAVVLGIAPEGDESGRRWRLAAQEGAPVHVTAHDLRSHPEPWEPVGEGLPYVLVCENPRTVQALAEEFGGRVRAICTHGTPEPLVVELLHRLGTSGAELRYHGDLDWQGVATANLLLAACRTQPWRMGTADYRSAVTPALPPLTGSPVTPSWDADLGPAMHAAGRAVPQEHVLAELVAAVSADLG